MTLRNSTDLAYIKSAEEFADTLSPWQSFMIDLGYGCPIIAQDQSPWILNPYAGIHNTYSITDKTWYCITSPDKTLFQPEIAKAIKFLLENDVEEFYNRSRKIKFDPKDQAVSEFTYNILQYYEERPFAMDDCEECIAKWTFNNELDEDIKTSSCDFHLGLRLGITTGITSRPAYAEIPKTNAIADHIAEIYGTSVAISNIKFDDGFLDFMLGGLLNSIEEQQAEIKIMRLFQGHTHV